MATFLDGLYGGEAAGHVVLVTGILGGGAAWLTGRAIARAWQAPRHVVVAMTLIAAAARFIHFALFHGNLLSLSSYASDLCIFLVMGLLAWRATRASQMVRQYPWLYARSGPLSWRKIGQNNESENRARRC
jgi:hypothetical protein